MAIQRIDSQYVSFQNAQHLTDEQKQQVWDNIGLSKDMFTTTGGNDKGDACNCEPQTIKNEFQMYADHGLLKINDKIPAGTLFSDFLVSAFTKDLTKNPTLNITAKKNGFGTTSKTYAADTEADKYSTEVQSRTGYLNNAVITFEQAKNQAGVIIPFTEYKYKLPVADNNETSVWSEPISLDSYAESNDIRIDLVLPEPNNRLTISIESDKNSASKSINDIEVSAVNADGKILTAKTGGDSVKVSKSYKYPYYAGVALDETDIVADFITNTDNGFRLGYTIPSSVTVDYNCEDGRVMWLCYRKAERSNFKCDQGPYDVTTQWQDAKEITLFNQTYVLRIYGQPATNVNTMKFTL